MGCCDADNYDPAPSADAGVFALPEQWAFNALGASQATTPMLAQVSTGFDDVQAMRAGSIVGLSVRCSDVIIDGEILVVVTINGVATALEFTLTTTGGGVATATVGAIPYAAADLIGATITSDADLDPDPVDVECWIQVSESV